MATSPPVISAGEKSTMDAGPEEVEESEVDVLRCPFTLIHNPADKNRIRRRLCFRTPPTEGRPLLINDRNDVKDMVGAGCSAR